MVDRQCELAPSRRTRDSGRAHARPHPGRRPSDRPGGATPATPNTQVPSLPSIAADMPLTGTCAAVS
jgi:hypothetical protein